MVVRRFAAEERGAVSLSWLLLAAFAAGLSLTAGALVQGAAAERGAELGGAIGALEIRVDFAVAVPAAIPLPARRGGPVSGDARRSAPTAREVDRIEGGTAWTQPVILAPMS